VVTSERAAPEHRMGNDQARLHRCDSVCLGACDQPERAAELLPLDQKRSGRTVGQWPAAEAVNVIRWTALSKISCRAERTAGVASLLSR